MKVTTYKNHERANWAMETFYYKNAVVICGLYDQLNGIAGNFKKNLQKATKEKAYAAAQEMKEALSQIGRGEQLTAPIRLYNCNRGYGFEISYLGQGADIMDGFFTSADDLATAVQDQMYRSLFSTYGLQETPFLYTIAEPYHFSEEEKKKAKEMHNYDQMDSTRQSNVDALLEAYVEYGLGPEERLEFERKYLKFFN